MYAVSRRHKGHGLIIAPTAREAAALATNAFFPLLSPGAQQRLIALIAKGLTDTVMRHPTAYAGVDITDKDHMLAYAFPDYISLAKWEINKAVKGQ